MIVPGSLLAVDFADGTLALTAIRAALPCMSENLGVEVQRCDDLFACSPGIGTHIRDAFYREDARWLHPSEWATW